MGKLVNRQLRWRIEPGEEIRRVRESQNRQQNRGARKVWGTRKGVTCDEVAKVMVRIAGKLPNGFSVMKRIANVNGIKLLFVVKAPERSLQCVDKAWNYIQVLTVAECVWEFRWVLILFVGLAPVSARHR